MPEAPERPPAEGETPTALRARHRAAMRALQQAVDETVENDEDAQRRLRRAVARERAVRRLLEPDGRLDDSAA